MLRRAWIILIASLTGCDVLFPFIAPPQNMTVILGGPAATQPFFGRFRPAEGGAEVGDFVLASCGCGDWRAVLAADDGTAPEQFPVRFFTAGDYVPTGSVVVYAEEDTRALSGTIDQDQGVVEGRARLDVRRYTFAATRSTDHGAAVRTCAFCHLGADPIWPLPETHPPDYLRDPTICLDCHSLGGP